MTPDKRVEWSHEARDSAQEAFNAIGKFFMLNANKEIPQEMLEACDYLCNYLGDIALGREITIDSPKEAFPTLISNALTQHHQDLMSEVRTRIKKELTEQKLLNDGSDLYIRLADALWVCDSEEERYKFTSALTEAQTIIKSK